MVRGENLLTRVLYIQHPTGKTNTSLKLTTKEQPAKGQPSRDLLVCSDAGDLQIQVMDAIDSVYDFFRFLHVSTRAIAKQSTEVI